MQNAGKRRKLSTKSICAEAKLGASAAVGKNESIVKMFERQRERNCADTADQSSVKNMLDANAAQNKHVHSRTNRLSLKRKRSEELHLLPAVKSTVVAGQGLHSDKSNCSVEQILLIDNNNMQVDDKLLDGVTVADDGNVLQSEVIDLTRDTDSQEDESLSRKSVDASSTMLSIDTCDTDSQDMLLVRKSVDRISTMSSFTSDTCDTDSQLELLTRKSSSTSLLTSDFISTVTDDSEKGTRQPYYLENFLHVLDNILSDTFYEELFNEEDYHVVSTFRGLNESCQKLYVRLFLRKHRWMQNNKIVYNDIADDLSAILECLVDTGLVLDESGMTGIEEVTGCLAAPDLKLLGKSLKINCTSVKKQDLATAIVQHAHRKNVSSFLISPEATEKMVLKRARSLLGRCYRLEAKSRAVFCRALMLFGLHSTIADDDNSGSQQIFKMLMSQIGRVKYPEYSIFRQRKIFADRDTLIRFVHALEVESELQADIEQKDYDAAYQRYKTAKEQALSTLSNTALVKLDESLPLHLRSFTAGAVFVRILTYGVEVLQFVKRYADAVNQLKELLEQTVYHVEYRGRWYDRLALNLDYHLKQPLQTLDTIKAALNDSWVRTGRRLALFQRAKKLCQSSAVKRSSLGCLWQDFENDPMDSVPDPPSVTIIGRLLPHAVPGSTPLYVTSESFVNNGEDVTVLTRVEDVALRHYADLGYPQGIHGEGSTVRSLFTLLMWDIIFMGGIPDVFYNKFQIFPLDIFSDNFFCNRRDAFEQRLQFISDLSTEALCSLVGDAWDQYKDTLCIGINWELFRDRDHILGLVKCIGGVVMAGISRRLAELSRYVTGGFPDLTVWNPETGKFRIVEVKGPGDRLSTKQILWLDYLQRLGVDAEVCYVKAQSTKKQ